MSVSINKDKFDYDQYEEVLKLVGLGKSKDEILEIVNSWENSQLFFIFCVDIKLISCYH